VTTSSQKPLFTQQTQQTYIHDLSGIRTCITSNHAAADLRFRPHCHRETTKLRRTHTSDIIFCIQSVHRTLPCGAEKTGRHVIATGGTDLTLHPLLTTIALWRLESQVLIYALPSTPCSGIRYWLIHKSTRSNYLPHNISISILLSQWGSTGLWLEGYRLGWCLPISPRRLSPHVEHTPPPLQG
jgi:hypothetical protein